MSEYLLHYAAVAPTQIRAASLEAETAPKQQPLLDGIAGTLTFVMGLCSVLMLGGGVALLVFNLLTPPSIGSATASAIQWIRDGLLGVALSFALYCLLGWRRFHSATGARAPGVPRFRNP